ncbi:LCP family protein [Actinacidiphila sp. DG2A-62]|jgi:LCP family protein required for cell wall assembly|uniref:LCP family protein n=1 Tax=Actinacidiphila sp. DG2A-62 TaxID=3108821 RepID=UPI002DB568C3|nr:LCP family protein [Actinacidiphila sp. DG2A-62]MEC3995756.1 LCP family protein [Actinacidiphila sp. DG2A-62]
MGVRGRKRERSRKRWIIGVVVALAVLVVGAGGAIYLKLNANISTFDAAGLSKNRPAAAQADANGDKPVNVLLIGSDTRSGENGKLGGSAAGPIGRSDTTILLHVYPDHKHAVGISIPRDSLVDIPPCLLPDGQWSPDQPKAQFNSAFSMGNTAKGNPACTQNTVEKLSGLRVDHTMVVDFAGFAAMTSAVHGVEVCVPNNIYQGDMNPNLGYKGNVVLQAGMQNLSGQKALDYVRVRHGVGDNSDVGRMMRQQAFLSALISKVKKNGMNPTTLLPLADAATKSLTVDPGLGSASKLMSFGLSLKNIDLKNIQFVTAPWKYDGPRIDLVHPDVDDLFAELRADRTLEGVNASGKVQPKPTPAPTVDGTGIAVDVFNGTTTTGLAGKAADKLTADHFTVTGTSTAKSQDHPTTRVEYGSADAAQARSLAKLFPGAELVPLNIDGINLVLGQDYAKTAAATPKPLSTAITQQARSADANPCSKLSYG